MAINIPEDYKQTNCYGVGRNAIMECPYLIVADCPNTCRLARRIEQGVSHGVKTGLERFMDKYGNDWRMVAFGEQGVVK